MGTVKYTDKETGEVMEFEYSTYQELANKYMEVDLQIQTNVEFKKILMDTMRREYIKSREPLN